MSKISDLLDRLRGLLPLRRKGAPGTDDPAPEQPGKEREPGSGPLDEEPAAEDERPSFGARLMARLRRLLPSGRVRPESAELAAEELPQPATGASAEVAAEELDEDRLLIERARRRLLWKKRLLIGVPVTLVGLGLLGGIALGVAYLVAPAEKTDPVPVETTLTAPPPDGTASAPGVDAPTDDAVETHKPDLEEELRQIKAERDALEEKNRALAERNRKLVEAAAKRNAPRPQRNTAADSASEPARDPSADCTVSDPSNLEESLRRCIDDFNATSR